MPPETPAAVIDQHPLPPTRRGRQSPSTSVARRTKAVSLRLSGLTYAQVAEHAGYATDSAARRAVMAALDDVQTQNVDGLRALECARLDRLLAACWQGALRGDPALIREARRITETRARLLGLNAPLQVEDVTGVDQDIAELRVALAADLDATGSFVVTDIDPPVVLDQAS